MISAAGTRTLTRIRSGVRTFGRDRRGIAAVEFSVALPFMLVAYLGSVEVGNAIATKLRVTSTARTLANLATQYFTIKNADMSGIMSASTAVMAPYSAAPLVITLSEVTTDASGKGTITWSDTLNGTARPVGQSVTLPSQLQTPNISLIWAEVKYAYTPNLGYVMTGTLTLSDQVYMYPRLANNVNRVNS
ncbi:MAG TPA: TadE/TadG family type IV pilus assembly protein [Xanthobacteraceae bacterium]|jgi:Flp pilus assembly protein TadG